MTQVLLVLLFIGLIVLGVPISYVIGVVAFTGVILIDNLSGIVVFMKMFTGLGSFVLLAVPLFILAANLMNHGSISKRLIDLSIALVGHIRGGLAHANILVSMIFAGVSGSSQADTAGVGKILIPQMEENGYDKGTSVGVTAASSTLGSIIPPSITMVVYAGIANVSTGALFMIGIIPGIILGVSMMIVVYFISLKKGFPRSDKTTFKVKVKLFLENLPALLTPVIIIGGIVTGAYTPTEAAAFASVYALLIGMFVYKTIKIRNLPHIVMETLKLSSLSLFALATANALGELLGYYNVSTYAAKFFLELPGGQTTFILIVILFFLFIGTFMDAVPAMILFVPVILPGAMALGVDPTHLGLIIVMTLALGLVTPPYGLCLLIAGSISDLSLSESFKGVLPYFLVAVVVLITIALFPGVILGIPKMINPALF
ncbi:TRAP transporter large permease [Spirochaeta isovalerica]|uniref:Tripartite ATP-independent transporter DctM subunit n=1 Tax=Spirochaeta isovalerica TaxID=150 RepID=A0A841RCB2_9SPIO|nr:TRAP transporter large permease [Spirochaeta isovalerica]MBB6480640.1 tripartite ATP-independent transporter DctM subunit [Spirochaeta isovalerica]